MKTDSNTSIKEKTRLSYYVHGIMCRMNKLGDDNLPDIGKSKANFKKRISTSNGAYKIPKEELKMWRMKTRIFEKKYTKKTGA
jgi:hypothetical protein